jgi:single-stranded-DNA-specific exonuclease
VNQDGVLQQSIEEAVHDRITNSMADGPSAWCWGCRVASGVLGIVAARIAERYHRPTFLLQVQGDTARGSGRSIPAFNLYQGLQHCARWLRQFGGHKYAAGLTMDAAHLPQLQEDFVRFAEQTLTPQDLRPSLHLDAFIALTEVTPSLLEQLACFAPHGAGNPTPLLGAQQVQIVSPLRPLGAQGQHVRFRVAQNGTTLEVIAFHMAEQVHPLANSGPLDIAFTPTLNTWQGRHSVELQLRALRPARDLWGKVIDTLALYLYISSY